MNILIGIGVAVVLLLALLGLISVCLIVDFEIDEWKRRKRDAKLDADHAAGIIHEKYTCWDCLDKR